MTIRNTPASLLAALTAAAGLAITSCERHSWEEAKRLHHHGEHGEEEAHHQPHGEADGHAADEAEPPRHAEDSSGDANDTPAPDPEAEVN